MNIRFEFEPHSIKARLRAFVLCLKGQQGAMLPFSSQPGEQPSQHQALEDVWHSTTSLQIPTFTSEDRLPEWFSPLSCLLHTLWKTANGINFTFQIQTSFEANQQFSCQTTGRSHRRMPVKSIIHMHRLCFHKALIFLSYSIYCCIFTIDSIIALCGHEEH